MFANLPFICPDLYYGMVNLNKDCMFQLIKQRVQNGPSLVMLIQYLPSMKTKKNIDLFKYFASPELCQDFGSLLLNMYTVNITPYFCDQL